MHMTQRPEDDNRLSKRKVILKPKNETGSPTSAGQLWRDRLNQAKSNLNQTGSAGGRGISSGANTLPRFKDKQKNDSARKNRKGFRAG
jgi:hypothetical protein